MTPSVHRCAECARNQDPERRCTWYEKMNHPEQVLNCERFRPLEKKR